MTSITGATIINASSAELADSEDAGQIRKKGGEAMTEPTAALDIIPDDGLMDGGEPYTPEEMAVGTSAQPELPGIPTGRPVQAKMLAEFGTAPGAGGSKPGLVDVEALKRQAAARPLPGQQELPAGEGMACENCGRYFTPALEHQTCCCAACTENHYS